MTSIFDSKVLEYLKFDGNSNKVFIYIADLSNCTQDIPKFWQCLSDEERKKAKKYYNSFLRDRYVIAHGILRYILSYYIDKPPKQINFVNNKYGKPFLKNSDIQFNISHSHNLASYIVALNSIVGIDIELHKNILSIQDLSHLVFTPIEYKNFATKKDNEKLELFYKLWTKKEALIKANGQGLFYPMNTIEAFKLLPGEKIFLKNEGGNIYQELWYYFPLEVRQNYSGAIAIEHKVNKIIYIEMSPQRNVFNTIRVQHFN